MYRLREHAYPPPLRASPDRRPDRRKIPAMATTRCGMRAVTCSSLYLCVLVDPDGRVSSTTLRGMRTEVVRISLIEKGREGCGRCVLSGAQLMRVVDEAHVRTTLGRCS
jgi:hypothetical protein